MHALAGINHGGVWDEFARYQREHVTLELGYPPWRVAGARGDPLAMFAFPQEIRNQDAAINKAMGMENPVFNTLVFRATCAMDQRVFLEFVRANPATMARKWVHAYGVFWQPIANYGRMLVAFFRREPRARRAGPPRHRTPAPHRDAPRAHLPGERLELPDEGAEVAAGIHARQPLHLGLPRAARADAERARDPCPAATGGARVARRAGAPTGGARARPAAHGGAPGRGGGLRLPRGRRELRRDRREHALPCRGRAGDLGHHGDLSRRARPADRGGAAASVVHAVDEPRAGRRLAIAAVEPAVGELQVVVVARAGKLAPPFRGDPPRTRDGDDAPAEAGAAHEAGDVALREDLQRARRPQHADDEAAGRWRRGGIGDRAGRWQEGAHLGGARTVGIDDDRSADAARPAERGQAGERGGEPFGSGPGRHEEPELRGANALGHGGHRHGRDRGTQRAALERDTQAAEERLHVARRGGEVERAHVASAIVEAEDQADARAADAVEPEARDRSLDGPAEHEEQGLQRLDRVLEGHRFLDVGRGGRGSEGPGVLAARCAGELDAGGAEADRDLGDRETGEIAEPVHAPAGERPGDVRRRRQAGERQRSEEAQLGAGWHHLPAVAVQRGEAGDGHAGADADTGLEPDTCGTRHERARQAGLAAGEVRRPRGVEEDRAVRGAFQPAGERGGDVGERTGGGGLDRRIARADHEVGGDGSRLRDAVHTGDDATGTRRGRGGHDARVRAVTFGEDQGPTRQRRIGTTRRRDGKLRNEQAGDAWHRTAYAPACLSTRARPMPPLRLRATTMLELMPSSRASCPGPWLQCAWCPRISSPSAAHDPTCGVVVRTRSVEPVRSAARARRIHEPVRLREARCASGSSTTSPKPPAPSSISVARSASPGLRGRTQRVRDSATPAPSAAAGSRVSPGSIHAMVSAAVVALAAIRQASAVRPALRAPASSVTRPRGRPPARAPSSAGSPVDSRPGTRAGAPRRTVPGRPSRSSSAAAFDTGHVSSFLRPRVNG